MQQNYVNQNDRDCIAIVLNYEVINKIELNDRGIDIEGKHLPHLLYEINPIFISNFAKGLQSLLKTPVNKKIK